MSFEKFQNLQTKHLPVILLLDVSGSMQSDSKISILNKAVEDMIDSFRQYNQPGKKIDVMIITFGGSNAKIHTDLTSANELGSFRSLIAEGMTPMGDALKIAKDVIEDKNKIPSNYYRPTVILVSDGAPNDAWETPLDNFVNLGRTSKSHRMSMGIGRDASEDVLKRFSGENNYYGASDASSIIEFFKFATMSVVNRNASVDPNTIANDVDIKKYIDVSLYDNIGNSDNYDDEDDDF